MIRWLKILRAEIVRDFTLALRYPVEFFFGVFMLYVLFMGMFIGAKQLAGASALSGNLDGIVIGFSMWFFALIAINSMSVDIESEARQGTLEQVYLHAPNFLALIWTRAFVKLGIGTLAVTALSILIQATTGNYLNVVPSNILALVATVVVTVAGLAGFGLILGGMSLVFKKVGQLSSLVQFSLLFPAYADLSLIADPWGKLLMHLPMARGVHLLKGLLAEAGSLDLTGFGLLAMDSLAYVLVGSVIFWLMDRTARKGGMLSHY